jgi:hypothetical protein
MQITGRGYHWRSDLYHLGQEGLPQILIRGDGVQVPVSPSELLWRGGNSNQDVPGWRDYLWFREWRRQREESCAPRPIQALPVAVAP